jgi:RNA polymerase subunit RPABC4/transcription elongation factor Spt4
MKYCPKCGAILEPNYKFCKNCGTRVGSYADFVSVGVEQTWKPTIAGALTISAGAIGLAFGSVFVTQSPLFVVGLVAIIISTVALAGGVCAATRRVWDLALAGSICSIWCWLGIPAIVFVALSKQEFS